MFFPAIRLLCRRHFSKNNLIGTRRNNHNGGPKAPPKNVRRLHLFLGPHRLPTNKRIHTHPETAARGARARRTERNEPTQGGFTERIRRRSEHFDHSAQSQEYSRGRTLFQGRKDGESYGLAGRRTAQAREFSVGNFGEEEF